jgi:CheY-like chemotaxis protein
MLASVSALLAADFDVVASVSDGRQALDAAKRCDPDVAVLDVTMPVMDGFQAARELRRSGARTRVVFLTMHQEDEFLHAAMACGASGFVCKTRIHVDLGSAVGHAVAGRRFLPSVASLHAAMVERSHVLQFHRSGTGYAEDVGALLGGSLIRGDVVGIVAPEPTRLGIEHVLRRRGFELQRLVGEGRGIAVDVDEALEQLMVAGMPDEGRLEALIGVLDRARLASPLGARARLTVFGELSATLWQRGMADAAVQMERLWNRLTADLPIVTVCAYPHGADAAHSHQFGSICDEHDLVSHTAGA